MRQAFGHEAILDTAREADDRAPGAAVTVALCGHWDHEPPCPLAPHHVHTERRGESLHIRVLFVTEPQNEPEVRRRIQRALSGQGQLAQNSAPLWRVRESRPSAVPSDETDHAERLMHS